MEVRMRQITTLTLFFVLSTSVVQQAAMADLPAPPDGPIRDVDAVSTIDTDDPIWLGPAIDDGLYEELPSSLPTDLPIPMPNPDLIVPSKAPAGHVLSHDLETGKTHLIRVLSGPSGYEGGTAGVGFEGLYGEDPYNNNERTFSNLSLVNNPSTYPRSAACRLRMQFTDTNGNQWVFVGSGWLIDAETMLTAGHCVYMFSFVDNGGTTRVVNDWCDWMQVFPGSHLGTDNWGRADATHVNAFTGWTNGPNFDWDIGMVRLDRAVGMLAGWSGWAWGYSCDTIQDRTYHNFSYPASTTACPTHNGADMYYRSGQFDSCPGNQLHIDTTAGCFTTSHPGMSGGGYYYIDGNDNRWVHALHSNGNESTSSNGAKIWENYSDYLEDTYVPGSRGTNFDLQAMYMRNTGGLSEPASFDAGDTVSNMRFTSANATNGSDSGNWYFEVYLSSDSTINTSDTLLEEQNYSWSYSAMDEVNVNMGDFDLPIGLQTGTYWIGVRFNSSTDGSSGNNDTSGWDAFEISVTQVSDASADSITSLDAVVYEGEEMEFYTEFSNNGAQWTYADIEIRASSNQNITPSDPLLVTYSSEYLQALHSWDETDSFTVPDTLADGQWYLGMIITTTNTVDGDPSNNTVASATTFSKRTRPSNDNCEDAILVFDGLEAFDTTDATTDGEDHPECQYGGETHNDIWYTYEAPISGIVTATTCEDLGGSADYDTDIVLYVGNSCNSLSLIGCNDDDADNDCGNSPDYHSTATGEVDAGDMVYVRVGAYSQNGEGSGFLNIYTRLVNDDCSNAIPIGLGDTAFSTIGATTDGPAHPECEESGDGGVTGRDIWHTFESPSSGTLTISTCDQVDYDSDLVAYQGTCDNLILVGCNDDGNSCSGYSSHLEIPVQQGQTYRLRVGGWNESQYGSGTLSLSIEINSDGDVNGDGTVDVEDLLILIGSWGSDGSDGTDLNGDGVVDVADLLILIANWE